MSEDQRTAEELENEFGVKVEKLYKPIKSESMFYKHELGDYTGFLLDLRVKHVLDKKEVEAGTAGAKSYGLLKLAIITDPKGKLTDDEFNYSSDIPYGRAVYIQYINFDPTKQYNNERLLRGIYIENKPQISPVERDPQDKNKFTINLNNLIFYYGAPIKWNFSLDYGNGKTAKNPFIPEGSLELIKHTLTKEVVEKRRIVGDKLNSQLEAMRIKEEQERKDKKDGGSITAPTDDNDTDDYLNDFQQ